jgi:hypothetical protein
MISTNEYAQWNLGFPRNPKVGAFKRHERHEKNYIFRAFHAFRGQAFEVDSLLEITLCLPFTLKVAHFIQIMR